MLTGYNTDVSYQGRVYHVQTEDRGLGHPVIESLVYCSGEILAARRLPYDELAESGQFSEETLGRRMDEQHRRLIQEIQNGRFDVEELKPFGHEHVTNRTLDEVVAAFLCESFPIGPIQLRLTAPKALREGERVTLKLEVVDRDTDRPICGAVASVQLVTPGESPRELFGGRTDETGRAEALVEIPVTVAGTTVVCRVLAAGRAAEIGRPVRKPGAGKPPLAGAKDQRV